MDTQLTFDDARAPVPAETAPALRDLAREILVDTATELGVSLELTAILLRRLDGEPQVHVNVAADELLMYLLDNEENALDDASVFMALARAGARSVMRTIEMDEGQ